MRQTAHKAVAGFLSALVPVVALWIPGVADYATPELISAVTALIVGGVVYFVPNRVLE